MSELTKRDRIALAVLPALCGAEYAGQLTPKNWVKAAFEIADEFLAESASTEPKQDGGWIEWGGGNNPFRRDTEIIIRRRDGVELEYPSRMVYWQHDGDSLDIIAYRVVKPVHGGTEQ